MSPNRIVIGDGRDNLEPDRIFSVPQILAGIKGELVLAEIKAAPNLGSFILPSAVLFPSRKIPATQPRSIDSIADLMAERSLAFLLTGYAP